MNTKHVYARLLLHKVQKVFYDKLCVVLLDFWLLVFVNIFGLYVLRGCELIIYLPLACLDPTQMGGLSMLLLAGEHALGTPEVSSLSSLFHSC